LGNGNIPLFNKVANAVSTQVGGTAPTNFNAVKDIVSNEIVKAIVGSGGGVTDRAAAQAKVTDATTPEQLKTVIDSYKNLFTGQLAGLKQQYEAGTNRKDFEKFLAPQTQAMIKTHQSGSAQPKVIDFSQLQKAAQ
jgi:hypothetical protein